MMRESWAKVARRWESCGEAARRRRGGGVVVVAVWGWGWWGGFWEWEGVWGVGECGVGLDTVGRVSRVICLSKGG